MVITLGNIVFGGKGNGGGSAASAYVVPNGMNFGYTSLTEFPTEGLDFSQKTNFNHCWYWCSSFTEFPALNLSSGTNFYYAWFGCSSLTSFPKVDLSAGTNFGYAWASCSKLASFPALNLSNGTDFYMAWYNCTSLTTLGGFGTIKRNIDLHWSTLLTVESLMNVINQAATVTGKTMTLGSTNLAKLTDEQKAVATNKGWTLA